VQRLPPLQTRQSGINKAFRQPPRPDRCVVLRQLLSHHIFAARLQASLITTIAFCHCLLLDLQCALALARSFPSAQRRFRTPQLPLQISHNVGPGREEGLQGAHSLAARMYSQTLMAAQVFNQEFVVDERYNVTKELGQGAYGIVW
jgi:hypothetical protein